MHRRVDECPASPAAMARGGHLALTLSDIPGYRLCANFRDTPYFVAHGTRRVQCGEKDLYDAGGVPVVMKELAQAAGLLHADCLDSFGPVLSAKRAGHDRTRSRRAKSSTPSQTSDQQKNRWRRRPEGNLAPKWRIVENPRDMRKQRDTCLPGPALIF